MVRPGTIAADTAIYPYGTVMYIPGYGYGRVEDTGGAVKGAHIDLYRPNHWYARKWGVRTKKVKVWLPAADSPGLLDPAVEHEEASTNGVINGEGAGSSLLSAEITAAADGAADSNHATHAGIKEAD